MAASGGRSAARVAAGILVTRVLGYVRERAVAHYIGNGWAADALSVGQRLANTIRNLLSEGTLSASFIPVYAALNERDEKAGRALAGAMLGLLLLAASVLALIGIAFAPALTTIFGAGLTGEARALAVSLTRLFFPMSGFMIISAWCLGILNTHRRFFLPYAAPAIWNVAGIAGLVVTATWLVSPSLSTSALLTRLCMALAWGSMAGSVLPVAIQLPACWQVLHGLPVRWSFRTEGVRDVLIAWGPVVLGAGVAQISGLIDTLLGTLSGEGGASSLRYAQLVQVLPISLFGTSVAAVSLPDLSRDAQRTMPNEQLRVRIALGFRRIVFFILPSSVALVTLAPVIVGPLFQTGRFAAADTQLVGGVLAAYGIGLLGQSTVKLFASGFYAMRDTRTPVRIAILSLIVSSLLSWFFIRRFGPAGVALGSSIGGTLNTVLHLYDLDKRIGTILQRVDWRTLGLVVVAALSAAGLAVGTDFLVPGLRPHPLARGIAVLGIFGVAYGALTLAFRHPDAIRAWQSLRGSPDN